MLACQFHWSSARAARVRFPADAAFLLERESQAFKQSGIHLWMAVNKGGKDNVFSMGAGRGRGGGEQTNRVISLHLSRKGGLKKNFSPAGNRTPVFRVTGGDTHHYTTEEHVRYHQVEFVRSFYRLRPYHVECTGSRLITEVKQRRARLVLGWVTAWESRVL